MSPPSGRSTDFEAPNPLLMPNIIIQTIVVVVTTAILLNRCIIRKCCQSIWTMEDWLCLTAWALFMAFIGCVTYEVDSGAGKHQWNVRMSDLSFEVEMNNIMTIIYAPTMFFSKVAVLVTYINVFSAGSGRRSREWWFIVFMIIANGIFYGCSMFLKIFMCSPRQAIWDTSINGTCLSLGGMLTMSGIWNTFSDVVVLVLPALFVRRLKMKSKQKWQIIGIFTIGAILYPIFSVVGIIIRVLYAYDPDQTYWQPRITVFSEAEIGTGLVCACIPSISYILRRVRSHGQRYADTEVRRRLGLGLRDTDVPVPVIADVTIGGTVAHPRAAAAARAGQRHSRLGLHLFHFPNFKKAGLGNEGDEVTDLDNTYVDSSLSSPLRPKRHTWLKHRSFDEDFPYHGRAVELRNSVVGGNGAQKPFYHAGKWQHHNQNQQTNPPAGILKTTEVRVQYDRRTPSPPPLGGYHHRQHQRNHQEVSVNHRGPSHSRQLLPMPSSTPPPPRTTESRADSDRTAVDHNEEKSRDTTETETEDDRGGVIRRDFGWL